MDNLVTSNIRQRPIRTLVSVAGIALGVSLVMLFTGLARGMSNDLQRRASNVRAELMFMRPGAVQLTAMTGNLDTRYVERLKAIDGIEEALPVYRHIFQGSRGFGFEQIDGVEWDSYASVNGINIVEGRGLQGLNEVVIDETKARNNDLKVGSEIKLFGDLPYTVVGVMPAEFKFPRYEIDLWTPLAHDPKRTSPYFFAAIARLKPGVDVAQAQTDTTQVLQNFGREHPNLGEAVGLSVGNGPRTIVTPMRQAMLGRTEKPLLVLLSRLLESFAKGTT